MGMVFGAIFDYKIARLSSARFFASFLFYNFFIPHGMTASLFCKKWLE